MHPAERVSANDPREAQSALSQRNLFAKTWQKYSKDRHAEKVVASKRRMKAF